MKPPVRIGILAVVVIAAGAIVALKYRQRPEPASAAGRAVTSRLPVSASTHPRGTLLLFANLAEADEGEDGCAIIIRTVRAARDHGIAVTEYNSGSSPDVRKQHRVVVEPTVILFDANGREIARHEGEDTATIAAIRADIERVTGGSV